LTVPSAVIFESAISNHVSNSYAAAVNDVFMDLESAHVAAQIERAMYRAPPATDEQFMLHSLPVSGRAPCVGSASAL
jgi:hypothetical protein